MVDWKRANDSLLEAQQLLFPAFGRESKKGSGSGSGSGTAKSQGASSGSGVKRKRGGAKTAVTPQVRKAAYDIGQWALGNGYVTIDEPGLSYGADVSGPGSEDYTGPHYKQSLQHMFDDWLHDFGYESGRRGDAKPPKMKMRFVMLARHLGYRGRQAEMAIKGGWEDGKSAR